MNIERALATPGFMAEIELDYLARLAVSSMSIVEIGSWSGRSARAFADNTPGTVLCVDTWADNAYGDAPAEKTCTLEWLWNEFHFNTLDCKNLHAWRMNSIEGAEQAKKLGMTFDLIFIDAGHNYEDVVADINGWRPMLAPNGVLCGHDYADYHPGVIKAVDELVPIFKVLGTIWSTE